MKGQGEGNEEGANHAQINGPGEIPEGEKWKIASHRHAYRITISMRTSFNHFSQKVNVQTPGWWHSAKFARDYPTYNIN